MAEEQIQKAQEMAQVAIDKINNKDFTVYFFTLDTKGNPTAGIANIYEHVKVLNEIGYKACILHEKNDYQGVASWLGTKYAELPHKSIENKDLNISPSDFIVIPEVFSNVMAQTAKFPCKRIVLCQSYDYILELINIGMSWAFYGIEDVITTSPKISAYVKSLFPNMRTWEIPVSIPDYFQNKSDKPKKPIIAIHTRDQKDTLKIIKTFYLQNPIYKWISFKDMRGMPREAFADTLSECCLSVWVDDISSFGTFPLESIRCNVPVIGKIPNMIPEWMELVDGDKVDVKNNGVWANNILHMPNLIAEFVKLWLEDNVPEEIHNGMEETKTLYTEADQKVKIEEIYGHFFRTRIAEIEAKLENIAVKINNQEQKNN